MKKIIYRTVFILFFFNTRIAFSQQPIFNLMVDEKENSFNVIYAMTQDQLGYIWFSTFQKGLKRYDGKKIITYKNDPENPNSLSSGFMVSLSADSSGMIWIATAGTGLDRFDPSTNTFTHYRYNATDPNSLSSDTVISTLVDRSGNLWLGTYQGLDRFDSKSGKFIHYNPGKINGLGSNDIAVFVVYEDKKGVVWAGCGNIFEGKKTGPGGLNKLDKTTGKFTHYGYNPADASSLGNNNISSIFEDSKGTFWVGTKGDGLFTMDRNTGKFTPHAYDGSQPEKLSRPPLLKDSAADFVSYITEDIKGKIWIASLFGGINCYDPATKKTTHFGTVTDTAKAKLYAKDTLAGFKSSGSFRVAHTKEGFMWLTGFPSNIYTLGYGRTAIPHYSTKGFVNSFYLEADNNTLWFGTEEGLVRKDLATQKEKLWSHDPKNENSLNNNDVVAIRPDENGNLWLGTHHGGLDKFDPKTGNFTHYLHDTKNEKSMGHDSLHYLFFEDKKYLWIGAEIGLSRMDRETGQFTNFNHDNADSSSLGAGAVFCVIKDKAGIIWVATSTGLDRYDKASGKFYHYLKDNSIKTICIDSKGILWTGSTQGLFYYEPAKDNFVRFSSQNFPDGIELVLNIIEDNEKNLWITTANSFIKINEKRDDINLYNASHGIHSAGSNWLDNYKASDGRLFIGGDKGYYSFYPKELNDNRTAPLLNFTGFKLGDQEIFTGTNSLLTQPIWKTEKIVLGHDQNTFSFDFNALSYTTTGDIKYLFMLENYEKNWHDIGTDHRATFFNVPHGTYTLKVKAINSEGTMSQKSIVIIITPPWWKTWWAYCIYGLLFLFGGWGIYRYQKHYILKAEREKTQERELAQAREIEKAYTELKSTQHLLVQSEKMASLGELTAGIAHEIQNPLNFVNNFSEVNKELVDELQQELKAGKIEEAIEISNDIKANEEKINHHGKRADAIVKGMLQHSRSSSAIKEPTDINALCDEYLRLAYHGLRAKDKSFNATLKTDFDDSIGNINIIPQDIGRVLLNLINNAFYAVSEKQKNSPLTPKGGIENSFEVFEPTVTVSTKKMGDTVLISVKDNGNGIPQKILDKIFQPFFTTKPTGQGTGLGLSLSYDIVKAHGGEVKVNTKENEGTTFTISLPA